MGDKRSNVAREEWESGGWWDYSIVNCKIVKTFFLLVTKWVGGLWGTRESKN